MWRKIVARPEARCEIVVSPDEHHVDEREPRDSAEYGASRQVVTAGKRLLVDPDQNETSTHDADGDPGRNPDNDDSRLGHCCDIRIKERFQR